MEARHAARETVFKKVRGAGCNFKCKGPGRPCWEDYLRIETCWWGVSHPPPGGGNEAWSSAGSLRTGIGWTQMSVLCTSSWSHLASFLYPGVSEVCVHDTWGLF